MIHDSSDEEYEGPTLHHAFDTMFENNDGFPFVVGGATVSVTSAHPSAIQIFQLWQIYINNVNPLLKLSHISTLQAQIISAGANTAKIAKPLEALMFAIYFSAITSLTDVEVQSTFGEDKTVLLTRFHNATQQALVNAGFMRSTELTVLQALLLYLVSLSWFRPAMATADDGQLCVRPYVDPRSLFCLIGIAVRIATRLGIHRDGAQFGLPPFETEQRRRLWWQLVIFDKRVAEITGSSITALSTCGGDCRFPLNLNDTDLNVHAKDPPTAYPGPTEMLFCLTRIELTVAAAPHGIRQAVTTPGSAASTAAAAAAAAANAANAANKPRVQYSPSPSSPDVVTHVASQNLPHNLESFCAYIENGYLKHCDPKVPLHFFTLMMTRQALCKLRVIDFLCRGVSSDSIDQAERDNLFVEAVRMVEYDNIIQSADTIQGFRWYTYHHFPFPAYIFLVSELRQRTTGDLCERAWSAMIENHERRGLTKNLRSPMHIAFGHFFVKAWDARAAAELQHGRNLPTPRIVTLLRNTMSRWKRPAPANGNAGGATQGPQVPGPAAAGDVDVGGPSSAGASADMYADKTMGGMQPPMGGMALDDNMMFGQFDASAQMYGPASMQEVDFNQMDWNYLVQYSSFGGFNPALYAQQQQGNGQP